MSRLLTAGILQQQSNLNAGEQTHYLLFNGTTDYVDLGSRIDFSTPPWTIEVKFKSNGLTGIVAGNFVGAGSPITYPSGALMETDYQTGIKTIGIAFSATILQWNTEILNTLKYNAAFVYNPTSTNKGYIDGNEDYTKTTNTFRESPNCIIKYIGRFGPSEGRYFKGEMYDLRIWDHSRTQQQINYYLDKKLTGNEPGLAAYYDFAKGPDPAILYDKTPNANHGQIIGATWVEL